MLKISLLPDRTKLQTLKPYKDGTRYRTTILVITQVRGCERGIVDMYPRNGNVDELWTNIHNALIRTMCELKHFDIEEVQHFNESGQSEYSVKTERRLQPHFRQKY